MVKLDDDVYLLYLKRVFQISKLGFTTSLFYYTIDSRFRTIKRLDKFIQSQLTKPPFELLDAARQLRVYDSDGYINYDKTIINIQKWVFTNISYSSDSSNWGKEEYWATAMETLTRKRDDCDGLNALIHVLARIAGVPSYLLFSVIGDVSLGGHYWLLYWSTTHRKIVSIDATWYPDSTPMEDRASFVIGKKGYITADYLFNDEKIYKVKK